MIGSVLLLYCRWTEPVGSCLESEEEKCLSTQRTYLLEDSDSWADDIRKYRLELQKKCDEFTRQLAEEGVAIAKANILSEDAIYTGELLNSMNIKPGDVIVNGASYHIYTACPWAKFVEFGTGIEGKENSHPDASIIGWKYDINNHGEKGWFYFKMANGIGQKVCRPDHSCTILHRL